tara:strand:+ start:138 stop:659 length:522 start_codon:yes stop_codon:yes gene_type:complete
MDYIDLDDNEFDNFLRRRKKRNPDERRARRKRIRRGLLTGGLSELGNKRTRRAVLTGGASELGGAAKVNPRIAKALLTGGLSERKAIRKLRRKCKNRLATARFANRRAKKRAMKECLREAIVYHKQAAQAGFGQVAQHTGVERPMPIRTARTKIGRAVSAMPRGAMGMFGRGR